MLAAVDSPELSGWLAYLHLQDEVDVNQMAKAFAQVFTPPSGKQGSARKTEEEEEIIDMTDPEVVRAFRGFISV